MIKLAATSTELTISWPDGVSRQYLWKWLMDNDPRRRHAGGQKLEQTFDMPECKAMHFSVESDQLVVEWTSGKSHFDIDWLRDPGLQDGPVLIHWDRTLDVETLSFNYAQLQENATFTAFLQAVTDYGWARIEGVPEESVNVCEFAERFTFVRETNYGRYFDVKVDGSAVNLADTALALPLHTDNPYREPPPSLQVLHCLLADTEGGDTILADGAAISAKLVDEHPAQFRLLAETPVQFRFADETCVHESSIPVIQAPAGNFYQMRFNSRSIQPFQMPTDVMADYYSAYELLERYLSDPAYQVRFRLAPGDLIVFSNYRVLHGRSAYKSEGRRHLQGCYADMDGLRSTLARLKAT